MSWEERRGREEEEEEEEEQSATDGGATGRGTCCPSRITGATEAGKESFNVAAGFISFVDRREKREWWVSACIFF